MAHDKPLTAGAGEQAQHPGQAAAGTGRGRRSAARQLSRRLGLLRARQEIGEGLAAGGPVG